MISANRSKFTAQLIAAALAVVSVLVFTGAVTDPVNVTKLFAIGGFAFAVLGSILNRASFMVLIKTKLPLLAALIFLLVSLVVLFVSNAPFSQSLYGVYGRNNGFVLYLCLCLLFIASLSLVSKKDFLYIIYALLFAGVVNVAYGLWVMAFGDFVSWNNQYGNLLGTFGNPNFIGSFFGMFSSVLFTALLSKTMDKRFKLGAFILLPVVFLTIMDTKAVQGKVLFVAAGGIALFFYVRDRFQSRYYSMAYIAAAGICFFTALMGTLQKGPLANLLYKESVSLRGEYWYSGWQTGMSNPWFGVGFDSLGDWYRRSRRESALTLPGVDTVINAAHNVYMDMFAFGGWPLFVSYTLISVCVLISIIRFTRRNHKFDFTFVALVSVWGCYQLQSIISINQVGLAIWGWVSAGLVISYTNIDQNTDLGIQHNSNKKIKNGFKSNTSEILSPRLIAGLLSVVGLLISVPPLSADMKWRDAQLSQDVAKFEAILVPSYMNPRSTLKMINTVGVFETNGFHDLAYKYAIDAIEFNPNSYESWRTLTLLTKSSVEEKNEALAMMKKLDPLNLTLQDPNK
jgi:O-antigen ligase